MRLQRCTALIELHLPVGFHSLPVEEQRQVLEREASRAVTSAIDTLPIRRTG